MFLKVKILREVKVGGLKKLPSQANLKLTHMGPADPADYFQPPTLTSDIFVAS